MSYTLSIDISHYFTVCLLFKTYKSLTFTKYIQWMIDYFYFKNMAMSKRFLTGLSNNVSLHSISLQLLHFFNFWYVSFYKSNNHHPKVLTCAAQILSRSCKVRAFSLMTKRRIFSSFSTYCG